MPNDAHDDLERSLSTLAGILRTAAREQPEVRAALARLAAWLAAALAESERVETPAAQARPPDLPALHREPLRLKIGEAQTTVEVPGTPQELAAVRRAIEERSRKPAQIEPAPRSERTAPPDLGLVARRSRLKAEACRWAITRRRRLAEGADFEQTIKPIDQGLARRAHALPDCRMWPLDPYAELPDDASLEDLAGSYEAHASAVELVQEVRADEEHGVDFLESAFHLMAETQSALRVGLQALANVRSDQDQDDAFSWLKIRTYEDHIYIARYMRLDDAAHTAAWLDRQQRIDELRQRFDVARGQARRRTQLLNRLRFHAQRIAGGVEAHDAHSDWQRVNETLDLLLETGVRASDVEVRDLLLPLVERFPEDLEVGSGFARVRAEVDRYLASREDQAEPAAAARSRSPEVEEVRALLRGKRVVLIGGHERRRSREALEREFDLAELRWISAEAHQPITMFEPEIARTETALVLLAIRWSSHSYEGVKAFCRQYGKPFARLPRGYGANQVAHEILQQVSGKLG